MTNSSPPNPQPSPEEELVRQRMRARVRQETTDEWIAIIVAFGTIGAILLWSLGFRKNNFFSTQWNRNFAHSGDRVENNFKLNPEVSQTEENLSATTLFGKAQEPESSASRDSFTDNLDFSLYGENVDRGRVGDSLAAIPLIGTVIPETETEPETEATAPETETEPETEATAPETETEPETEATAPETETEPETEATAPETETEPTVVVSFDDVTEQHWAYPFLQELGKQNLVAATSDNNFEPDDLITRAGMATLISQAFDQPTTNAVKDFKDIEDENIIAENINEAVGIGFMKGYSDEEFRPTENIPRYQVLVALATGLGLEPSGDPVTILQNFGDRDQIPNWAISQVAAATEAGLAVNRPDFGLQSLNPETPATRAEVAAMIYQALQQSGKVPAVESPNIVPKP